MSKYSEFSSSAPIWKHYLRDKESETAMCKITTCKKILKISGGSTKGLHTHLQHIHNINVVTPATTSSSSTSSLIENPVKKPRITNYFTTTKKSDNLPEILSRMIAKDGLSIHTICNSSDIRAGLVARGFLNVPKSRNTIRKMVIDFGLEVKKYVIKTIVTKIASGQRFSLTFDEWTSTQNRRFMNLNVHEAGKYFWNLGLVRVFGSMPAEKCIYLLKMRLIDFEIKLDKNIVGATTDGPNVMKKVGKLLPIIQQLCFAHAIQLAIISVLYSTSIQSDLYEIEEDNLQIDNDEEIDEPIEVLNNSDDDSDDDPDQDGFLIQNETSAEIDIAHEMIGPVIKKVRKIVLLFKRSPTKNENYLQKYVKIEFGKVLHLKMDCKTRWSSLFLMLERFNLLKTCIQKAFLDFATDDSLKMNETEFKIISDLVLLLAPIKATVEALCRQDANLITADIAMEFMLSKIKEQNCDISRQLFSALSHRIQQRRTQFSSLLMYLHNGHNKFSSMPEIFVSNTNAQNKKIMVDLIKRLDNMENIEDEMEVHQEVDLVSDDEIEMPISIEEQLNLAVEKGLNSSRKAPAKTESTSSKIQKEMSLFEGGGSRGDHLQKIYNYLITIKPTSVEAERAFSAAGYINSKIRNRLNDKMLDTLCFLRSHFQK